MDCSPPGSSVRGISQARILEWVAISFSRDGVSVAQKKVKHKVTMCPSSFTLGGRYPIRGFPGASDSRESACIAEDPESTPGSGRSPGAGNGNPLQNSSLGNAMDRGAWWTVVHKVIKSQIQLRDLYFFLSSFRHLMESRGSDTCTPISMAALFTIAKRYKPPKCPSTDEWINKM